jgi:hypothetical protein
MTTQHREPRVRSTLVGLQGRESRADLSRTKDTREVEVFPGVHHGLCGMVVKDGKFNPVQVVRRHSQVESQLRKVGGWVVHLKVRK